MPAAVCERRAGQKKSFVVVDLRSNQRRKDVV